MHKNLSRQAARRLPSESDVCRANARASVTPWLTTALLGIALVSGALRPSVAAEPDGTLYISSEQDDCVYRLDAATLEPRSAIPTSARPRALALNPAKDLLYAACGDGDAIDVIDLTKGAVVEQLDVGDDPEMFALSPDGARIYVSNEDDGLLTVFDLASRTKLAEVEVGEEPEGVLATPDGSRVYVTSESANMVHVVDARSFELLANLVVGNRPRRFALTPDGSRLWVTNEIGGTVSVIDTATNQVVQTITFAPEGFRPEHITPVGLVINRAGDTAYISLGGANHVAVVAVADGTVRDYVLVGKRPWGLALSPDESRLYVTNGRSDDLSVIDTGSLRVLRSVPIGRVPHSVVFQP